MQDLIYEEESYLIRGACFEVYKVMGNGFLEAVYQECLEMEFHARNIPFQSQQNLHLHYKGTLLQQTYKPDFVCFDKIIVEIKGVAKIHADHKAQIINYLAATEFKLGMLVNFGASHQIQIERFVN